METCPTPRVARRLGVAAVPEIVETAKFLPTLAVVLRALGSNETPGVKPANVLGITWVEILLARTANAFCEL